MRRLTLQAALVLIFLGSAIPLRAFQVDNPIGSTLDVCNKGTVPVEVVIATREEDLSRGFFKYTWEVGGYPLAPQTCKKVYEERYAYPAYIAFGFNDSKGEWGAGKMAQMPDFGTTARLFKVEKVLTGAAKPICARKDQTGYSINDDFQIDCATAQLSGRGEVGHGPLVAVTSALLFWPGSYNCNDVPIGASCNTSHYYLNIAPKPGDRELHATEGTEGGEDAEPPDPDMEDPVKALKKLRELVDALQLKQYPACNVITKAEVEAVLGVSIDPPQPGKTLCRYQEPGYGVDASKKKQVTVGIWRSTAAAAEDVNNRRNAIVKDKSLLPVSYKELPDFGDAAFWVWAGGYYGALYAFRGGMVEVAVKISGIPEDLALSTAKKWAARALGGTGKTGFVYAARKNQ
jgi:hypothetical protein